ncbi:TPA: fimbrial protein [Citrobacter braakii]|nr:MULTISPECIES: fimbrial protein [Citrobacter]OCF80071.1 hypothetical protein AS299_12315 [Citrobacter freundii]EGT5658141.1 fimbrial protein [Citrobacter braakii]EKW2137867.1 fimbrial protein [Citrobacter braakii]MBA8130382.1 fimbrial protein [Citrobacter sp. RHBSTW-00013]MBS6001092.1 fimbrial protein [Citrobacter sp.]
MKKLLTIVTLTASCLLNITPALADYVSRVDWGTMNYALAPLHIPAAVGGVSGWTDRGSILMYTLPYSNRDAYIDLTVNGTLLGDGVTWATNNPGIGVQYLVAAPSTLGIVLNSLESITAPNYPLYLTKTSGSGTYSVGGYYHLKYRLVRLLEKVPAGKVTTLPNVTLNIHNGSATEIASLPKSSGLILSGIYSNIPIDACTIVAPSEIKLPNLYGNQLQNGAQNVIQAPKISLNSCPGAVDGISYRFTAVYGTHNAANGVLNTMTGQGYASNVYIQLQNTDGTPHPANSAIAINNYDGSGNYDIPDFKVGYFIDNTETVTAGIVKTAIELQVTYN